jgi:GT2 family glycosyltransferase
MDELDTGRYDHDGFTGVVSGCLMLVRGSVFEDLGMLDERFFFGWEDIVFCAQARRRGFGVYYTHRAVVHHKVGRSLKWSPQKLYNGYLGAQLYLRTLYGYGLKGKILITLFGAYAWIIWARHVFTGRVAIRNVRKYAVAVSRAINKGRREDFNTVTKWDCFHGLGEGTAQ